MDNDAKTFFWLVACSAHYIAPIHYITIVYMSSNLYFFLLQASGLSVAPFFVENISEMQLDSLKLVTNVSNI